MQLLDHTCATPEQNLALEEALIFGAENAQHGEVLRFWESPQYFVVLGAGGATLQETHLESCQADHIPILRRCSGGGTVLQGPGCLNYTMLLDKDARPELATIDGTNHAILTSVANALKHCGADAQLHGISDLTSNGLKFSGNAQRRRKRFILFHGTILHRFDLELISRYLREPQKQPDYRQHRPHTDFVRNIGIAPDNFKRALAAEWQATTELTEWPQSELHRLVTDKYSRPEWNRAF